MTGNTKRKASSLKTKGKTTNTRSTTGKSKSKASASSSTLKKPRSLVAMRKEAKDHPDGPFRIVLAKTKGSGASAF